MHDPSRPGEPPDITAAASSRHDGPTGGPRTPRDQLVDRILRINTSADPEFLGRFAEPELSEYLEHLLSAQRPRGRRAVWVRKPGRPGIVTGSRET